MSYKPKWMRWTVSVVGVILALLLMTEHSPSPNSRGSFSDLQSEYIRAGGERETTRDYYAYNEAFQRINAQGAGINFLFLGLQEIKECDTCLTSYNRDEAESKYYWALSGFNSSALNYDFYKQRNYYRGGQQEPRIACSLKEFGPDISVLFPLSRGAYQFWRIALLVVMIPLGLFCLYSLLMLVHVLENIALGRAFDRRNSRILYRAAWVVTSVALAVPIGTQLLFWILRGSIPVSLEYPFWEEIFGMKWVLAGAVVLFLLAKAFQSGYRLQQEHSLTV